MGFSKKLLKTVSYTLVFSMLCTGNVWAFETETDSELTTTEEAGTREIIFDDADFEGVTFDESLESTNFDEFSYENTTIDEASDTDDVIKLNDTVEAGGAIDVGEEIVPLIPENLIEDDELVGISSVDGLEPSITDTVYDPRIGHENQDANLLSTLRYQGPYNLCWAFSTIANCEASYNKNSGITGQAAYDADNDFSERQIAYYTYYDDGAYGDPVGYTKGDSNLIKGTNGSPLALERAMQIGGTIVLTEASLAKGIGPVREKYAPYGNLLSPLAADDKYSNNVARLKNSSIFVEKQKDIMKKMILTYGAVGVNYYSLNSNYKKIDGEVYYNYSGPDTVNHGVSIVGWKDTVSANTFTPAATQDGAYLCKNSNNAEREYFWMSYDCMEHSRNAYALEVKPALYGENTYEYDGSLWSVKSNGSDINDSQLKGAATFANIFKASCGGKNKAEYITGVMVRFASPGSDYSIQIYKNPDKNNPESGTALLTTPVTGTVLNAGFKNIEIGEAIALKEGDKFSVVVKSVVGGVYLSVDEEVKLTSEATLICDEALSSGCSYYKTSSGEWMDFTSVTDKDYTARIKAVTKTVEGCVINIKKPKKVTTSKTYPGKKIVINMSDGSAGAATYQSSNPEVATVDSSGVITAKWAGKATITIEANGKTYKHKVIVRKPSFVKMKSKKVYPSNTYKKNVKNIFGAVSVSWNSANEDIATVDAATGEVYARKAGTTYIYASFDGNREHYIRYKLKVTKFSLNKKKLTFNVTRDGSSFYTLKVKYKDKYNLSPVWSSSNPEVATVDQDGTVTSMDVGKAYIAARIADQVVSCNVIVK